MKLNSLIKSIKYVWYREKVWVILSLIISVIGGILPLFSLHLTQNLINQIQYIFETKNYNFQYLSLLLVCQFLIGVVPKILTVLKDILDKTVEFKLDHELQKSVFFKTTTVPLFFFDLPEFHNQMKRVTKGGGKFLSPFRGCLKIFEFMISTISYIAFLYTFSGFLVLFSFLLIVPFFMTYLKFGKERFKLNFLQVATSREVNYYNYLLSDKQNAKEIRLFDLGRYFMEIWSEKFNRNKDEQIKLVRKQHIQGIGLDSIANFFLVTTTGIIVWVSQYTKMTIGDFVSIGQALQGTHSSLNQIASQLSKIYEDSLYIDDFFNFIDNNQHPIEKDKANLNFPVPLKKGITFKNVSFKYIRSDNYVLKNLNFHINQGEKVAIVGSNGSGKTTLVLCLMGLLPISNGEILFDGINIKLINENDLRKNITVAFQDFVKYQLSIRENIGVGNLVKINNIDEIKGVATKIGLDSLVDKYPSGYETHLGKIFKDGEDLSGGQWQKLGIARALLSDNQILILDEPTAALDPLAESKIFADIHQITKDKTAVFISHRMAATKLVDKIIVLKNGEISEMGTFEDLIKSKGEFYKMYSLQQQWLYNEESQLQQEVTQWR